MNILFLSSENACRSQIAESLTRVVWPGIHAFSTGCFPADNIHEMTLAVLEEKAIFIEQCKPKGIEALPVVPFEFVFMLCGGHRASYPVFSHHSKIIYYNIPSPPLSSKSADVNALNEYRKIRDSIFMIVSHLPQIIESY